ncbi:MAG TPA: cyclic nucleotide-binding domain-containing protein [Nitrospirota bacterium]|nr:cyclic nucleotide-binding domain-containing protein [Nitrospirota bacterium]
MNADLLKNVYLFRDLSMTELVQVLKICKQERFPAEKFIFLENEPGDRCYIIETGEVKISKYIPGIGDEALKVLRTGDYFGEMALIDGSPRSATATAKTDVAALVIDKAELDRLLAEDRDLGNKLLTVFCQTLSKRLRETNEKISRFIAMTAGFGGPI